MEEMRELIDRLNELNYHYYTLDEPLVADAEYDQLYDKLVALEKETGHVEYDSPTTRVGGEILQGFERHQHLSPLASLDKAQNIGEVEAWITRTNRLIDEARAAGVDLPEADYLLEYKFDGLSINLTYNEGRLVSAATRGDGQIGEEILAQIRTIQSIPLTIGFKGLMEVQGEGVMPLSRLTEYNKKAEIPLKNARNAAAGALRNLDPKVTRSRNLDAYFYSIGYIEGVEFKDQEEILAFLVENKLKVSGYQVHAAGFEEIKAQIEKVDVERHKLDVLTDGMVIKINNIRTREVLGSTVRAPRWAIAYKFEAEEFTTVLREVQWNVGRTGKVTPSAVVDPVEIGGATIRRATLNNIEDIERKNLAKGVTVFIRRSNDVIPEILGRVEDGEEGIPITMPSHCPACHTELMKEGVHYFCPNSISCKPQIVSRLEHFASRPAMDIEGLSEKTAIQLVEELGIDDISKVYELTREDLLRLEGFKDRKTDNLLAAIDKSKLVKLENFINALGIPGVGVKTSSDLATEFKTLDGLKNASYNQLITVPDIGQVIAENIVEFFHDEEIVKSLDNLIGHGIVFEDQSQVGKSLEGLTIVLTGTLDNYVRRDLQDQLEARGAKVTGSVSRNTDYLIAGANPGSKYDRAVELGTKILGEDDIEKFLKGEIL